MNRRLLALLLACLGLLAGATVAATRSQATSATYTGVLTTIWIDYQDGRPAPPHFYLNTAAGQTFELVPGQIAEEELQVLNLKEVVVTARTADGVDATDEEGGNVALLVDGIRPLATEAAATPSMLTPTRAILGNTRWISIGCKFPDRPEEAHPLSYFDEMYANTFPGLDHYWREVSNNHIALAGSGAVGWYVLPQPYTAYLDASGGFYDTRFREDCIAAADPDVYFPDYYGINLIVNGDDLDYAMGGSLYDQLDGVDQRWGITWMTQWTHAWISEFEHEMGHAFNLEHSYVGNWPGAYRNIWDVMSKDEYNCTQFSDPVYGCYGQHTIARNKAYLGWIEPDRVYVADEGTHTVTLERSAFPGPDGYLMVEIPVGDSTTHYYTLEARQLVGYDNKLPGAAVIIHEVGGGTRKLWLVDAEQGWNGVGAKGDPKLAMWEPGETFNSEAGGISVHVDAATPTGFVVTIKSGLLTTAKVLNPSDDTYVRADAPNVNYGREPLLQAEQDATGDPLAWTLLKFDAELIPATTYRLRMRLAAVDDGGMEIPNDLYVASPVSSGRPWTETDLTWNYTTIGWPAALPEPPVRYGDWIEWDVTVTVGIHGGPCLAVGLGDATGLVTYSSKEGAAPPQLIVEYLVPPSAATPTATATATRKPKPTATATPSPTPTRKPPTATPTATNTPRPSATATATLGPSPTATATATATATSSATPTASPPPSATPVDAPTHGIWLPFITR